MRVEELEVKPCERALQPCMEFRVKLDTSGSIAVSEEIPYIVGAALYAIDNGSIELLAPTIIE